MLVRGLALAALAAAAWADTPVPSFLTGTWTGERLQGFALANPQDQQSWECIQPASQVVNRPAKFSIGSDNKFAISALDAWSQTVGIGSYTAPAQNRQDWVWASYDEATGIVQLRPATNLDRLQCFYLRLGGQSAPSQSTSDKLTMVILGGAAVSTADGWKAQCNPASYNNVANLLTAPQCLTSSGSKSPVNSTVVYSMTFTSSSVEGSGAAATGVAAGVAAVLAGAAAMLF